MCIELRHCVNIYLLFIESFVISNEAFRGPGMSLRVSSFRQF